MQTSFSIAQLADPDIAEADQILRACVHCGFCTATCPTYLLLGDEDDSPRGRIYLIKDMLEKGEPARREVVKHVDRCLSCLSCMTTCPSGVHYMHLVDHARAHVEKTYRRPISTVDAPCSKGAARSKLFRCAVCRFVGEAALPLLRAAGLKRVVAMLNLAPARFPRGTSRSQKLYPAPWPRRPGRAFVGVRRQCAGARDQRVRDRVLNRHGFDVVVATGEGCCGSLAHHMGDETAAHAAARRNITVWINEIDGEGVDAILTTASGCGTTMKDYGFMFRTAPDIAGDAARVSKLVRDISEFISEINYLKYVIRQPLAVATTPPVRCSTARKVRRCRRSCWPRPASRSRIFPKVTSAADRQEHTTFCSPNWQIGCVIAKSRISK
jgi:glycolate oxidase iron-sulfur subunit